MAQTILFLRKEGVASREAAKEALKTLTHKVGQPAVVFYTEAEKTRAMLAIGKGNGAGLYEEIATFDDMVSLYSNLNKLIENKANKTEVYTTSQTYSRTEVNDRLSTKANVSDVYTKTEVEGRLKDKVSTTSFNAHTGTKASASALGHIKAKPGTKGGINRDYDVQILDDGTAFVNVPWTDTKTPIPNITVTNAGSGTIVTGVSATGHGITVTKKSLVADDIPNLPTSKINSGTFDAARIPSLNASKINDGIFAIERIPNIPASKISDKLDINTQTTGTIAINRLPAAAIETLKIVTDDTARFKLTLRDVQNGDTVKVTSTGKMYFVKDDSQLSTEDGYEVYVAGSAASATLAESANKLNTDGGGNLTTPVYFSGGVPKPCTPYAEASVKHAGTAGSATTASKLSVNGGTATTPVYFSGGVPVEIKKVAAATKADSADTANNATTAGTAAKLGSIDVGNGGEPIYLKAGVPTKITQVNYAVRADRFDTARKSGGATTPVYINDSGYPTECTPYAEASVKHAGTADTAAKANSATTAGTANALANGVLVDGGTF